MFWMSIKDKNANCFQRRGQQHIFSMINWDNNQFAYLRKETISFSALFFPISSF